MSKNSQQSRRRAAALSRRGHSSIPIPTRPLRFEQLEDRRMLATFSVSNLDGAGTGSLRGAIDQANNLAGADTIQFAVALSGGTIELGGSDLEITEALTIDARPLVNNPKISGQLLSRIFDITATTGNVTLAGLTLISGRTTGDNVFGATTFSGGAIRSLTSGILTLDQSRVSGSNTEGHSAHGGGIYSLGSVTLTDSTISGNEARGVLAGGGGIYSQGTVTLTGSTVSGNQTTASVVSSGSNPRGGGIRAGAAVTLTDSSVSGNSTRSSKNYGGGIYSQTTVTLTNSTVSGNNTAAAFARGGGIYSLGAVTLTDSTVSGNRTTGLGADGGGISSKGNLTLTSSTVSGNFTTADSSDGGGIFSLLGAVTLANSTVSGNRTAGNSADGGGIYSKGAVTLVHSTVTDNQANHANAFGGGVWNDNDSIVIDHSIVAGNTGGGGSPDLRSGTGTLTVNYSLIGTGVTPDVGTSGNNVSNNNPGLGPLANNGGPTRTRALLPGSPAIDAGDPGIVPNPAEFDQRGAPLARVFDDPGTAGNSIDIGAYEQQVLDSSLFVVTTTADELDYSNAAVSLREAIASTNGSPGANTITFDPAVFATPQTILLALGDIGISEAIIIDATAVANVTIDAQQNSRIFEITTTTGDFTLAGLTLTGGLTIGDNDMFPSMTTTFNGAVIRSLSNGTLTLDQTTVSGNRTTGDLATGGGIFSQGILTLTDSTVSGNSTAGETASGGGISSGHNVTLIQSTVNGNSTARSFATGGGISTIASVTLTDSTVSGNSTTGFGNAGLNSSGGGIHAGGLVTLTRSTLSGNSTTGFGANGGGIRAFGVFLNESTVSGNTAISAGAGISTSASVSLYQSTVSGNRTRSKGGGIHSQQSVFLTDSTVSGNRTTETLGAGGGIYAQSTVNLTRSTVSENWTAGSSAPGGGIYSQGTVTLIQSTVSENWAQRADGGGIWNSNDPIVISGSILAGNTADGSNDDLRPGTGTLTANYSLIGTGVTPDAGTSGNNLSNDNPGLGPLANNGGPTQTRALLPGSPAIDAGDPGVVPNPAEFDQRGAPFARVIDDSGGAGNSIDIGAYERQVLDSSFFVVTTTVDELDYSNAAVSLREAINSSGSDAGANTITFDAAVFDTPQTILLTLGQIDIGTAMTIDATAVANVTIDAQQNSRIFEITATTGDFTLAGLTLTGGQTTGGNYPIYPAPFTQFPTTFNGGAIRSLTSGNLTLDQTTVSGNSTTGYDAEGGGISASSDVTLTNSTVSGNSTAGYLADGGGIFTSSGVVTLTDSTVSGNSTAGDRAEGGGIYAGGAVTVTDSTVSGNSTDGYRSRGGGIRAGALTLTDSTVSENSTTGDFARGGGIHAGNVTLNRSTVSGNSTAGDGTFGIGTTDRAGGGGIYATVDVTLTDSTVSGNSTAGYFASGGGIFAKGAVTLNQSAVSGNSTAGDRAVGGGIDTTGVVTVIESTVSGNSTAGNFSWGGGISSNGAVMLMQSTITDNHANYPNIFGGGIQNFNGPIVISGSILAGNTGGGLPDLRNGSVDILTVNYSLIGTKISPDVGTSGNNVSTDNPGLGPLGSNGGPTQTHALLVGSPAIDAGDPGIVFDSAEFDQRGAPFVRVVDDETIPGFRIDIGAYERQTLDPSFFIVTTTADELDYSNADVSLREAINIANENVGADTITFDATVFATPQSILLSLGKIDITEAVTIDATSLTSNVTIDAQQQSRIFDITATVGDFTLAGLTLTGGLIIGDNANSLFTTFSGGAVRSLTTGNLTIDQSTVSGNSTTGNFARGGGVFSVGAVTITSSTISGNSTASNSAEGGGIYSKDDVSLINSTVSGNSTMGSGAEGGGIYSRGLVTITSSTVSGNSTTGNYSGGGGTFSLGAVTIATSTVSGNSTAGNFASGGGIRSGGTVTLASSTVTENHANASNAVGGGIWNSNDPINITNSIVAGNTASGGMNDLNPGTGSLNVNHSLIGDPTATNLTPTGGVPGANGNIIGGGTVDLQVAIDFAAFGDFELTDQFDLSYTVDGGSLQPLFTSFVDEATSQSYTLEDGTIVMRNDPLLVNGTTLSNVFQTLTATIPSVLSGASVEIVVVASTNGSGETFVFRNIVVTELDSGSLVAQALATSSDFNVTFTQDDPDYSISEDMFGIRSRTSPGTPGLPQVVVDDSVANPPDSDGIIQSTDTADFFGVADTFNFTGNDTNIARWTLFAPSTTLDPMLGPLANNGGTTEAHALMAGSLAIDAGDPSIVFNPTEFDQREAPFVRVDSAGSTIDIGAFELQSPIVPSADFDGSGFVTGLDFLAWQRGFGTPAPTAAKTDGDADNDGDVDNFDLAIWESQFGGPAPLVAAAGSGLVDLAVNDAEDLVVVESQFGVTAPLAATAVPTAPTWTLDVAAPLSAEPISTSELAGVAMAMELAGDVQFRAAPSLAEEPDFVEIKHDRVFAAGDFTVRTPFGDDERPTKYSHEVGETLDQWLTDELLERVFS